MMFDAYAVLAAILRESGQAAYEPAPVPISTISTISTPPDARAHVGRPPSRPPDRPDPETLPYGCGVSGSPRTWSGRVVSLDEWRRLTEWEKHGSTGKTWNGLTRRWQPGP